MTSSLASKSIESRLGHAFAKAALLDQALTHRSYFFENRENCHGHNERLEFLGDAVLDLIISDELMRLYRDEPEGVLSKWRASLVNETSLAEQALKLELDRDLKVGRGDLLSQIRLRPRLLASAFEALVGAVYLDGGLEKARELVLREFAEALREVSATSEFTADYKTRLQERIQKQTRTPPDYRIVKTEGPDHNKIFFVEVSVKGKLLATGSGTSRKQAEQRAARLALGENEDKEET